MTAVASVAGSVFRNPDLRRVQLVPAAIFAPFASGLGDRFPPARVLALAYVDQAAALGATAVSLLADAPAPVSYAACGGGCEAS